jgi:predicted acetyltransferase
MSDGFHYGRATEADLPALGRLIMHAFAGTSEGAQEWFKESGLDNVRVVRPGDDAPPSSCLLRIPMAQFFGGRSVSMLGIAGVGTAPESRGRGDAKRMMAASVREAAEDGFAIATLYPSTQALYRSAGYEQAGHRLLYNIPLPELDLQERSLKVDPIGDSEMEAVKACYGAFASRFDGMVDRGAYVWRRVRKWIDTQYHGFGIRDGNGGLEGYVFLAQKRREGPGARQEINLSDLAFLTPRAGRRLLTFLADFGTMGDEAIFAAGPSHPALMLMPLQKYRVYFPCYWMVRILNLPKALMMRGYPLALTAELHLDVSDELVPANAGRFVVHVSNGRAEVQRGGRGELRTGMRGLAAMFTGHMSPAALAMAGLIEGEQAVLTTAGGVFGGGCPWMTDFF